MACRSLVRRQRRRRIHVELGTGQIPYLCAIALSRDAVIERRVVPCGLNLKVLLAP